MPPPLLDQLRERTRPAHLDLEAQPALQRLVSTELTLTAYGQLLQAFLAFYQALEPALVPAAAALLERHPDPVYRYLPRAPLLAEDCRALGLAARDFIHPPIELRLSGDGEQVMGVLYVIEGSTQGGRLIAPHLDRVLNIREDAGARFFGLHRWNDSWTTFRAWSGRYEHDIERVIEGAEMTFTALRTHLDRWPSVMHGR